MDFLEPTETEQRALEALRLKLIAAREPAVILNELPGMLADAGQNHKSMLTLVGALPDAERAIGYGLEAIRIISKRAPQPGRLSQTKMLPTIEDYEASTDMKFADATQDQRDAYQLDCAKFFIISHIMASMGIAHEMGNRFGKGDDDILSTPNDEKNGVYYAVMTVGHELIPQIARLQGMSGQEAFAFMKQPHRPMSGFKGQPQDKPTRQ